jgi:hypothetical protein
MSVRGRGSGKREERQTFPRFGDAAGGTDEVGVGGRGGGRGAGGAIPGSRPDGSLSS